MALGAIRRYFLSVFCAVKSLSVVSKQGRVVLNGFSEVALMDDDISEDQLPLWPVFEISKFKCPCCDHVLILSLSQVAWLLHEESLTCSQCRQGLILEGVAIDKLNKRQRCVQILNASMNVLYVILLALSLILAFAVVAEAGAFVGALGTVILGGMRYFCSFGRPAIELVAGKPSLEK